MKPFRFIINFAIVLALLSGCRKQDSVGTKPEETKGILVTIGDSVLRVGDVEGRIPAGLSSADSAALFNAIVKRWVSDRLASDVAINNIPNPEVIENMVKQYRISLVLDRYRRMMVAETSRLPEEDSLKSYYERYRNEMISDRPIIKGLVMCIDEDSPELDEARKRISGAKKSDVKRLEEIAFSEGASFENFSDMWVDFNEICEKIPARNLRPEDFQGAKRDFEIKERGKIYLLHLSEVLPSGSRIPYDFARAQILDILMHDSYSYSEERLYRSLLEKGMQQGSVKSGEFDASQLFKNK